jgi:hypothetical protein
MRVPAVAAVVFFLVAGAGRSQVPSNLLSTEGPLLIHETEAPLLFRQCSREAPVPEGPVWLPSEADVAALEAGLAAYVATLTVGARTTPPSTVQYRGQYVGFTRGGTKLIYGSFSPAGEVPISKGRAVVVCDGGPFFWGIVYNPASGEFSELHANGP